MKKILLIGICAFLFSCTSNSGQHVDSDIVPSFLEDVKSLNDYVKGNPILVFQEVASMQAEKTLDISKDNIASVLEQLKSYKHCVITTGDHTIVKFSSLDDCKQSGSWSACMPMVKGYIKKGDLVYQEDYMNNIIGLPDDQERKAYFFN